MKQQAIVWDLASDGKALLAALNGFGVSKPLLVCGGSFQRLPIKHVFQAFSFPYAVFDRFTANPLLDDVWQGVLQFNQEACDAIIAVGGGSAIDVAKCIKLFCKKDRSLALVSETYADNHIPLIAIPTTAGTGSESTPFAVIYHQGEKQSISHPSILPHYAILVPSLLQTLPPYQKKCTMLDALCQGIESWWSVNSSDESKSFAKEAIALIMAHWDAYVSGATETGVLEKIMLASNLAGQAISITQTTAPHAMSYKLTSLYQIPHGHAVAICLPAIWEHMLSHIDDCVDSRGKTYLYSVFRDISNAMGFASIDEAISGFQTLLDSSEIQKPLLQQSDDIAILAESVNEVRLKNNPVFFNQQTLRNLYSKILIT